MVKNAPASANGNARRLVRPAPPPRPPPPARAGRALPRVPGGPRPAARRVRQAPRPGGGALTAGALPLGPAGAERGGLGEAPLGAEVREDAEPGAAGGAAVVRPVHDPGAVRGAAAARGGGRHADGPLQLAVPRAAGVGLHRRLPHRDPRRPLHAGALRARRLVRPARPGRPAVRARARGRAGVLAADGPGHRLDPQHGRPGVRHRGGEHMRPPRREERRTDRKKHRGRTSCSWGRRSSTGTTAWAPSGRRCRGPR